MSNPAATISAAAARVDSYPLQPAVLNTRQASVNDLALVNQLIEAAMSTWRLSEKIKRISLPLYRYDINDLEHLHIVVAETDLHGLVGVAAIEAADSSESPEQSSAALLHGIYIDPRRHRCGLGVRLLQEMETCAAAQGFDGLLVKAQRESATFFETRGYEKLPLEDHARDYPYRYWKSF